MAKKKAATDKQFPKTVFVTREHDGDDSFLVAADDTDSVDDGDTVAIYELREVKTKRVTHTLLH